MEKNIRRRVLYRIHNDIVTKLEGDIVPRLRRLERFLFRLINYDNTVAKYITTFKLNCPRSTLAEYYKYLLYKYKFSHSDLYSDIGNIISKIPLATMDDSITYTVMEL